MAVTRENILKSSRARDLFIQGINALSQQDSGVDTPALAAFISDNNLPIPFQGIRQNLSLYDLFVFWHVLAMAIQFRVGNAAHQGPIFLPWHRMYLLRLEEVLRRVTGQADFGLPYWDWAADGDLPAASQPVAPIWGPTVLGPSRGSVATGPFSAMRVRLWQAPDGTLHSIQPRRLLREAGSFAATLPRPQNVQAALAAPLYDAAPWDMSAAGHRNRLEGWPAGPQMHNRVHVWVGGDMLPASSPNDPVFFLNHCNVDRVWEDWMLARGRNYAPGPGQGPSGHRLTDRMVALFGQSLTPRDVLDPAQWYGYAAP